MRQAVSFRRAILAALLAVLAAQGQRRAVADDLAQTTTVRGAVPDLTGRWLVVLWLDVKGQGTRTNPAFWQVGRDDKGPTVAVRLVSLPPDQQAKLDEANHARQPWHPTTADVAAVAAGWDTLPPRPTPATQVETTLVGHDAFDASLTGDPHMQAALFAVQQQQGGDPKAGPVMQQSLVLGITAKSPGGGYTGNCTTGVLAAAPFPVAISFDGTFELYPLDASPGLLGWLRDLFAGCARR
jgi:hypothetical protein